MKPFMVLDEWKWGPHGRYASKIGRSLTDITFNKYGLAPFENDDIKRNEGAAWFDYDLHAEVRMTFDEGSEGEGWHQDGDTSTNNMDCALVLWTSAAPTLFRWAGSDGGGNYVPSMSDETIYQPEPFQLVIARNLSAYHRKPADANKGKRFLFRQRVEVPYWLMEEYA